MVTVIVVVCSADHSGRSGGGDGGDGHGLLSQAQLIVAQEGRAPGKQ